jgi:hypothetical protein
MCTRPSDTVGHALADSGETYREHLRPTEILPRYRNAVPRPTVDEIFVDAKSSEGGFRSIADCRWCTEVVPRWVGQK